jgi:hypothetical protein
MRKPMPVSRYSGLAAEHAADAEGEPDHAFFAVEGAEHHTAVALGGDELVHGDHLAVGELPHSLLDVLAAPVFLDGLELSDGQHLAEFHLPWANSLTTDCLSVESSADFGWRMSS